MISARIAFALLCGAVTATIVATCLLGLGAFGDAPREAATVLRAELPQAAADELLSDRALDRMTTLVLTTPAAGAAACVANSVRVTEQCYQRCDGNDDDFHFNSGVCGFATRCDCDQASATSVAITEPGTR